MMFTYRKIIMFIMIVSLSSLVSLAISDSKPNNLQASVIYSLVVEEKVSIHADTISCRLRVKNNTEELQFLSRPKKGDISLDINGLDQRFYSVVFAQREFENLANLGIYLRPKCTIEMELAKIEIVKSEESESAIPQGMYSVTASWEETDLPKVEEGVFEVVDEDFSEKTEDIRLKDYEYALGVELESALETYYKDEPVLMTIRLHNKGTLPISMKNYVNRYKDFFEFEKTYAITNEKVQESQHIRAAITPEAIKGSITLFPKECLSVDIDASNEFKLPTEYKVSVNYRDRMYIHAADSLPYNPNYTNLDLTSPVAGYYTNRSTWPSNEVHITVLNTPRVTPVLAQENMLKEKQFLWSWLSFVLGIVSTSLIFGGLFILSIKNARSR